MFAYLFLFAVIAVFVLYRRSLRPKQLEGGEWLVYDHSDGPLRTLFAVVLLFWGTQFVLGVGIPLLKQLPAKPGQAIPMAFVLVVGYLALLYFQGRKLYEALHAAPGEFLVDNWPLAAGERIHITYKRKLRVGIPAGDVEAALVHYEVVHDHRDGKHVNKRKRVVSTMKLTDGEATYQNKELTATWRFQVPNTMGNPIESLQRSLFEVFANQHREDEWWALEVKMPLQGGLVLDSEFKLDIQYIQGRTEMHLGA